MSRLPWGVERLRASLGWQHASGYRINIGLIDTGIDVNHPDLAGSIGHGLNLIEPRKAAHDDNGHGTHIAGIIAATNGAGGMMGIAPRSTVHPIKAFDGNGSAYVSDIVLAIEWCIKHRFQLINMSFGMKKPSRALHAAVLKAYRAGILVIASAGNDGRRRSLDYPAAYAHTIAVGASTKNRKPAAFSNGHEAIDIFAPGESIKSCWLGGAHHVMSGTSMATAHVTGAIALLQSSAYRAKPADVRKLVHRSNYARGELDVGKLFRLARDLHALRRRHADEAEAVGESRARAGE